MIFLDATQALTPGTGIGRYTADLIAVLSRYPDVKFLYGVSNKKKLYRNRIYQYLWTQVLVPIHIIKGHCKVYHYTDNFGVPFLKLCRYVVTVHDIIPIIFAEQYLRKPFKRWLYIFLQGWALRHADMIITVSAFSKNDIISYFHIPPEKIKVIYPGLSEKFREYSKEEKAETVDKMQLSPHFILGIGGDEYRKNISTLIQAFTLLQQQYGYLGQLIIVGRVSEAFKKYFASYQDVKLVGLISDADLVSLYNTADIFAFPSLYEGFGLPVLEAMACGTPVVTSNVSSMPEIAGTAAKYVDPHNVSEIAAVLHQVLSDKNLSESMRIEGKKQAFRYSCSKSADQVYAVYKDLLSKVK